jgi:serine/threonine protein kinase
MAGEDKKTNGSPSTVAGVPTPPGADSAPRPASDSHPSPLPFPADTPLERYELIEEVGRGGMGLVYKARDRETGELVALKVLKPEVAAQAWVIERFVNELRLARKITHKNVCRIHDLARLSGTACISMEFVEGESLRQVLRRFGELSPRKAVDVALQICAGLREAHGQGIIHRDLKPENIMIGRDGGVKIMDFGIAKAVDAEGGEAHTTNVVGTPAYMAPEQFRREPADHRADLYALGLILYEMASGQPAFTGESTVALLLKHLHEAPQFAGSETSLPPGLQRIVLCCLEKDMSRRYQSAEELEADLQSLQLGAASPRKRSGQRAVLVGVLAVVLLGGFGLGWLAKPVPAPASAPQPLEAIPAASQPASPAVSAPAVNPPPSEAKPQSPPQKPAAETARYPFDLRESGNFAPVGPVRIRLNKADPKRQLYTLTVEVKDKRVEMRDRALLEPVRFYHEGSRRMLELVVSRIEEKRVEGYLVAPKSLPALKPAADGGAEPAPKRSLFSRLTGR